MAQWNHADKTLYAKLVYYGPAYGGKTSNLEAIHKITRHDSTSSLLSVQTSQDRTLFFDLLPFDLGHILGYKVALKLFTVPGQVQYNATRRVVLSGADAVVFVADSTRTRVQDNRESLKDLADNMKANKLDPAFIPVLIQYNKQDVPDAMTPDEMEQTYGVRPGKGFPAVAIQGEGVMETFLAAAKVMLRRLVDKADGRTRDAIDTATLNEQVDKAFAPYLSRADVMKSLPSVPGEKSGAEPVVVQDDGLLEQAVETSLTLGEQLSSERLRARRLERESRTYRLLGESLRQTGASFDPAGIIGRTLSMAAEVAGAAVVSLVRSSGAADRDLVVEHVCGADRDPLSRSVPGHLLLARLVSGKAPTILNDLTPSGGASIPADLQQKFHAIAGFPVDPGRKTALVAYAPGPDGRFAQDDIRFLSTAAAHLAVGLEKARLYQELRGTRDRLEVLVQDRTRELREAYEEIQDREQVKDRFLSNLSHEMRTPLTTVTSAATFLRDYDSAPEARREMADSILDACGHLTDHLENLFRAVQLRQSRNTLQLCDTAPARLAEEAVDLAGRPDVEVEIHPALGPFTADVGQLGRAVANLLDNAVKFGTGERPVILRMEPDGRNGAGLSIAVLDRNPEIPEQDRERVFQPFEQGGDPLTGKPAGIGLGLYESRSIAELHGGRLVYRPLNGGGNEFRMLLPVAGPAAKPLTEVAGA